MKFWRLTRTLPQPLKAILMLFNVAFAVTFIGFLILALSGRKEMLFTFTPWMLGSLGVIGFLLGLFLLTDFRGSTQAYSGMMKKYKPMGVDYSGSPFSKPAFLRFFGAVYMLVGAWFVVLSTLFGSSMRGEG